MTRPRSFQTEAVVLKKTKLGEADRILTFYTPDMGKTQGVAKGIRRPKSKMAGHLELLGELGHILIVDRDFLLLSLL